MPYQEDKIRELTTGIIDVLNRANQRGKIGNELLMKLKELGGMLFDQLVPRGDQGIAQEDRATSNLMLAIDDRLVHVPWELLYDGADFLCQRFSMGRSVSTKQAVSVVVRSLHGRSRCRSLPIPAATCRPPTRKASAIKNEVASFEDWLDVSLKTTDITTDYAKAKIRNFDIVHYAGHAEHNTARPEESGWLLKDGSLRASEVMSMAGSRPMPALVFSNACQTGQTDAWKLDSDYSTRIFGMANAFLLSGVQHYIGTFWEIPDEAGALFARAFYRSLVTGATVGEALRAARRELIEKYGEDTIVWASYMLYGDPTTRYAVADADEAPAEQEAPAGKSTAGRARRSQSSGRRRGGRNGACRRQEDRDAACGRRCSCCRGPGRRLLLPKGPRACRGDAGPVSACCNTGRPVRCGIAETDRRVGGRTGAAIP